MSLVFRGISHRFGDVVAADGVDLEIARGEITCLFGPSGCGKTTLLRIAAGLEPIQAGTIILDGKTLASPENEVAPEHRPIGMVFQDYVLFPHMTVEKNIAFGVKGMKNAKAATQAQIEAFDLGKLARRYPHELSGGQQQRVALARALAREPGALLLDEPFASIDSVLRRQLREELRRVLIERNVAVALVTHDPEEALALGDTIALMRAGRIVETRSPEALFHEPQTLDSAQIFPGSQTVQGIIKNGELNTPIGVFDATGLCDGPGVAVVRAGALSAHADDQGDHVVAEYRFVGPDWIAYVDIPSQRQRLRVSVASALSDGVRVSISCNQGRVFCYEKQ